VHVAGGHLNPNPPAVSSLGLSWSKGRDGKDTVLCRDMDRIWKGREWNGKGTRMNGDRIFSLSLSEFCRSTASKWLIARPAQGA
jgi:hypothetical protein